MINAKKFTVLGIIAVAIGAASVVAFAASAYDTPAEAVAGLTGKTVESVTAERAETGKTYGQIAADAGKLEEFKDEMLEMKKEVLDQKVADGVLTRERADEILAAIEKNQADCDGTGSARIGRGMGAGFGRQGQCDGSGIGMNGAGRGQGRGSGVCGGGCR